MGSLWRSTFASDTEAPVLLKDPPAEGKEPEGAEADFCISPYWA